MKKISRLPGLKWRQRRNGVRVAYWVSKDGKKSIRLWAGRSPTAEVIRSLSDQCHRLQRETLDLHFASSPEPLGVIYFIRAGDNVKIGYTTKIRKRLEMLQTASALDLKLVFKCPGNPADEKRMHRRFSHLKVKREWFQFAPEMQAFIEQNRTHERERRKVLGNV